MLRNFFPKQSIFLNLSKSLKHRPLLANFVIINFCSLTQNQNQKKRNPHSLFKPITSPSNNNKKKPYSPNPKTEKNHDAPIEYIFSNAFHKFNQSLTDGRTLQKYNAEGLDQTITAFWNAYIGIKKIVDTTRQSHTKENQNLKFAELGNVNIYLPNSLAKKNETFQSFHVVMEKITKFLEKNEANIVNDLSPFVQLVKSLSKFEQVQEYLPFWELYDRILVQVLEKYQNPTSENMNNVVSLLKHYSTREYYLNRNSSNSLLRNTLSETQAIEEKYLNFITKNIHSCSLKGLMSLMVQYQYTESRLVSPLYSHIQTLLKDFKDVSEVVQSINKTQKFRKVPEFANLYITMRDLITKYALQGQLRVPEISTVLWSIGGDGNMQEREKNFEILWNLLEHNVKVLKHDDFNIFHISSLYKILTIHSHFWNHQRFTFLEDAAIRAFDNLKNLKEKNRAQIPTSLIASSSQTLLEIYTAYDVITSINPLLFSRIAEVLTQAKEQENVKTPHADLIFSSAKLTTKLSKNLKDPEIQRKLLEQARKIASHFVQYFVNRIDIAPVTDVVKVFDALCQLNIVDAHLYSIFQKALTKIANSLSLYNCIVILSNLHSLDQRKFSSEGEPINTTALRNTIESQRTRILTNPNKSKLEIFESIAYVFSSLSGHDAVQFIVGDFERQIPEFAPQLHFDKLAGLVHNLSQVNLEEGGAALNEETFKKLKPTLMDKIDQGDTKSMHQLVKACIDSHLTDPELFKLIEKTLLEKHLNEKNQLDLPALQNLANIFGDLAKCFIEDPNLITRFEEIFQKNVRRLRLQEALQVLNALGTYLSQNIPLIKEVLSVLDKALQNQENSAKFNFSKPTALAQNFQMAIYTIELEYSKQINLKEYPKVLEMNKKLNDHMELIRYRKPSISIYQRNILNNLKALKIEFEEEQAIGVYLVDFLMKPNKILEVNGPKHYRYGTKELVWRYAKKVRQLEKLGYKVVILPYFEWTHYDFSELKFSFLKNLLQLDAEKKEN